MKINCLHVWIILLYNLYFSREQCYLYNSIMDMACSRDVYAIAGMSLGMSEPELQTLHRDLAAPRTLVAGSFCEIWLWDFATSNTATRCLLGLVI